MAEIKMHRFYRKPFLKPIRCPLAGFDHYHAAERACTGSAGADKYQFLVVAHDDGVVLTGLEA